MKFIKKVPIPLAGVMLGFAALGNLLQSYSEGIRSVCGIVAGVLLVLLILKLVCFPGMIREDMKNQPKQAELREDEYWCPKCKNHVEMMHAGEFNYFCGFCGQKLIF